MYRNIYEGKINGCFLGKVNRRLWFVRAGHTPLHMLVSSCSVVTKGNYYPTVYFCTTCSEIYSSFCVACSTNMDCRLHFPL